MEGGCQEAEGVEPIHLNCEPCAKACLANIGKVVGIVVPMLAWLTFWAEWAAPAN